MRTKKERCFLIWSFVGQLRKKIRLGLFFKIKFALLIENHIILQNSILIQSRKIILSGSGVSPRLRFWIQSRLLVQTSEAYKQDYTFVAFLKIEALIREAATKVLFLSGPTTKALVFLIFGFFSQASKKFFFNGPFRL